MSEDNFNWSPEQMLEVTLKQPDDFLKIRETLSRIGVASRKDKTLFQSCHILHKQGKYYIVHFKELFALDGKKATLVENDIQRRNTISVLLQDWNLLSIVKPEVSAENKAFYHKLRLSLLKKRANGIYKQNTISERNNLLKKLKVNNLYNEKSITGRRL